MPNGFDRAIAEVARRQHGTFTAEQARAVGGTRQMLDVRHRAGTIERIERGVFRVAGAPLSWEARVLAVALGAGDGAAISHRAAAAIWGLEGFNRGTPEVSIPRGRKYRRPGVRTHESTDLHLTSIRHRQGIPVTDPARTLLDLARFVSDKRLWQAIESARRQRLTSWPELVAVLVSHARRGRPGIRRLRRTIARHAHRKEITDTDFELLVLALLLEHDLPEPVVHFELRSVGGVLIAEVDLAYPHLKIAIELDGRIHQSEDAFERDRPRQNRIALEGWVILRFTWATFRDRPEVIVDEVRTAIRRTQRSNLRP